MKQRNFPWISALSPPTDEDISFVAQCKHYGMAARLGLETKPGGPWTESWLASRLEVSRGYMSRVLNGDQNMPRWMLVPIAWATGSNAVFQFDELQRYSRTKAKPSEREIVSRLAQQARAAA